MGDCVVRQTHLGARLICLLAVAFGATAAEYFVDQKHPQAADGNPGTEQAPWKTIQKAAETVVAGDTAWIKGGEYRETVWIKNDGEFKHSKAKFISFLAWGDDPVVLVGTRPVAADEWQPVAGQKDVFAVSYPHPSVRYPEPDRYPTQVFVNGKRLPEAVRIIGVDEATGEAVSPDTKGRAVRREHVFYEVTDETPNCWTVDTKKQLVIVNAGGGNPAVGRTVEISEHDIWFDGRQYIRIKGLRLHRSRLGLHCSGSFHCIIEDCLITEPGGSLRTGRSAGIHLGGAGNIIRRNTIVDSQFQGIYWTGHGFVIEDNLINRCGLHPAILPNQWFGVLKSNAGNFSTIRNNVLVDAKKESGIAATGVWCDISSEFNAIYGNTVAHEQTGIYVELTQNFNFIGFNALQDLHVGVGLRANNWCLIHGNYINRTNRAITAWNTGIMSDSRATRNWLLNSDHFAVVFDAPMAGKQAGSHDYNVFWPEHSIITHGVDGGRLTDIASVREATGNERHGEVRQPTDDELGMIRIRVPYAEDPQELLPMLANPMLLRQAISGQIGVSYRPYFWRPGRGDGLLAGGLYPGWKGFPVWPGGLMTTTGTFTRGAAVMSCDRPWTQEWRKELRTTSRPRGHWGLKVTGGTPAITHETGEGWWTPSLPTTPGTRYRINLQLRAQDLKPFDEKGGPVVFALWTNDTGQQPVRSYLLGVDDAGKAHAAKLCLGTFGWTRLSGEAVAPESARRVAFFLGLRRASGAVGYDEIWLDAE